jgi:hypothetical protein
MSKGFFTNKAIPPTPEEMAKQIGMAKSNWNALTEHLYTKLKLKGEFKFYGVNYGWALRFNKSGKSVIALYPNTDTFSVQIILNKNQVEAALQNEMDKDTIRLIENTESIHEGKWIYATVGGTTNLKDILTLLNIRLTIK